MGGSSAAAAAAAGSGWRFLAPYYVANTLLVAAFAGAGAYFRAFTPDGSDHSRLHSVHALGAWERQALTVYVLALTWRVSGAGVWGACRAACWRPLVCAASLTRASPTAAAAGDAAVLGPLRADCVLLRQGVSAGAWAGGRRFGGMHSTPAARAAPCTARCQSRTPHVHNQR
jgi:hypothetical protein